MTRLGPSTQVRGSHRYGIFGFEECGTAPLECVDIASGEESCP
jgi:hypothetical protein